MKVQFASLSGEEHDILFGELGLGWSIGSSKNDIHNPQCVNESYLIVLIHISIGEREFEYRSVKHIVHNRHNIRDIHLAVGIGITQV